MAVALEKQTDLEPYFDDDTLRHMGNELQFISIKEPQRTRLKEAYGITDAEQAKASAEERFRELFDHVIEMPAATVGDCVLKLTMVDRVGRGGPVVKNLLSDFQAIGVIPNWQG